MGFEIETKIFYWDHWERCRIIPLWKNGTTITMTENLSGQKKRGGGRCRHQCYPSDGLLQNHGLELNNQSTKPLRV